MDLKEAKRIIKWQDQKIGELTRKVEWLEDTEVRRESWRCNAKKQAGYPSNVSFEVVWEDILKIYKKSLNK